MGRTAEVKAFERTPEGPTVQVDMGGGDVATADVYQDAGVDAPPLPGDAAALEDSTGSGNQQATGFTDPKPGKAAPGEHRVYARDPSTGEAVCEMWCKNAGEITIQVLVPNVQIHIKTSGPVHVDSPDVRLGPAPGRRLARVGDLVAVNVPQLVSAAPGSPCVPVPPTAITPTGGYQAVGQIISGCNTVKGGP